MNPTVYMLVGLPASGKTTWCKNTHPDLPVVSTDDRIEAFALSKGKTYNDVFKQHIGEAEKAMLADLWKLVKEDKSFIWDQTNTTAKTRAKKLAQLPPHYKKVAVVFEISEYIRNLRQIERNKAAGKNIPAAVINTMRESYERPSESEGFDGILLITE